ncbi:LamB/YcsF family protein [Rothia sp. ND6WE1A]|uniref:LamB/YcsF family protein n=1 Tax=Rothia sp. ND6WE1A TaxID=1848190 RepID=UPI00082D69B8|nr:5-oxoprolinase subunit PxpA [Rothia sp. ND6WE1A]
MTRTVDLNSDSGEAVGSWSMGDDAAMMKIVSSANIACGFHAGDPLTMRSTVEAAAKNDVSIGAHVSYPDLVGFGRRFMDMTPAELSAAVLYQMGALEAVCRASNTRISYVKPHGGLYNAIVHHEKQAEAVAHAVKEFGSDLPILCLPNSEIERKALTLNVPVVHEVFADRGYTPEGTLVPRTQPGAVIHDVDKVAQRVLQMATEGTVVANDGSTVTLDAQSICVHGDTPGAVAIAQKVRETLTAHDVEIRSFCA